MKYRVAWGLVVLAVLLVGIAGGWWVATVFAGIGWRSGLREGVIWKGGNYFGVIGLAAGVLCALLAVASLFRGRRDR